MIQIQDTLVSKDIFTVNFLCDLEHCHGACCVYGAAGAPLKENEVKELEEEWENYKPCMKPEGIKEIETQGFAVLDFDRELTTPLINGGECVYSYMKDDITWCATEKAWIDGKTKFQKPISCHLYPIRVTRHGQNGPLMLRYSRWDICRSAEINGIDQGGKTLLFRTLKEPLIRRFGSDYYQELVETYENLKSQNLL